MFIFDLTNPFSTSIILIGRSSICVVLLFRREHAFILETHKRITAIRIHNAFSFVRSTDLFLALSSKLFSERNEENEAEDKKD